jgi:hypothetical protein
MEGIECVGEGLMESPYRRSEREEREASQPHSMPMNCGKKE